MQTFPANHPEDSENVLVALEVGRAMWGRGDRRDAMKWLRQAIDEAFEAGDDARGLDLSKQAADMASDPSLAPPPLPDGGPIDIELPGRASDVPLVPLRAATGRFAALRAQTVPPPQPAFGGASARPVDDAPPATPAPTPLARVPLGRMSTPLLTVASAANARPAPSRRPRRPRAPRWARRRLGRPPRRGAARGRPRRRCGWRSATSTAR
jgi:hypothetical protein